MLEQHKEEVVRENARTIVCSALHSGNLELADKLASGARETLEKLERHKNKRIRIMSRTIMSQLFGKGSLDLESVEAHGEIFVLVVNE